MKSLGGIPNQEEIVDETQTQEETETEAQEEIEDESEEIVNEEVEDAVEEVMPNLVLAASSGLIPSSGGTLITSLKGSGTPGNMRSINATRTSLTTSGGWGTAVYNTNGTSQYYAKVFSSNGSDNFTVTYYNVIHVGIKYYDVKLTITNHSFYGNKQLVGVSQSRPGISVNQDLGSLRPASADRKGYSEVGFTAQIYEAGTSTKATIPNIVFALTDLDGDTSNSKFEGWALNGYTPSASNLWYNVGQGIKYKGNVFFGTTASNEDDGSWNSVYTQVPSLTSSGTLSGTYGYYAPTSSTTSYAGGIYFYTIPFKVTYSTDGHGVINGTTSEEKVYTESPAGRTQTPNTSYVFTHWTNDQAVTLSNGTTLPAGSTITEAQIKQVLVDKNINFTAHYKHVLDVKIKKGIDNNAAVENNPEYSVEGVRFALYSTQEDAISGENAVGAFTISNGESNAVKVDEGEYYLVELEAGPGLLIPDELKAESGGIKISGSATTTINIP